MLFPFLFLEGLIETKGILTTPSKPATARYRHKLVSLVMVILYTVREKIGPPRFILLLQCLTVSFLFLDSNYSLPEETNIGIIFRTTTRSGLLLSITNSSGPGSVTLEQLEGQVRHDVM